MPYDCIIDVNSKLLKIQIKRGYQTTEHSFIFNNRTVNPKGTGYKITTYHNSTIDYFVVWYDKLPELFFVFAAEDIGKSGKTIYYGDKPTAQQNYFKDYILDFSSL